MHVDEQEGTLGQIVRPLASVGVYVPAGTAPLPSSLLMAAVIARVAGVETIIACAPPDRTTGQIPDVILAAAEIAGIDALYALGGAQAIAAMAFGTETVPAVDKIVGPGGLFVTLAKRQVFGTVGIDGLPGPTETVVIADETANPAWVAADLLAQAEHDVLASAILLTPSQELAEAVQAEIGHRLEQLSRADIIAVSLESRGGAVITPDLNAAVAAANAYAPEHLCLSVADPWALVPKIKNAGGIFVGDHSFEVLGRLHRRAIAHHAHRRHRPLRFAAQRRGFRQAHQPHRPQPRRQRRPQPHRRPHRRRRRPGRACHRRPGANVIGD